MKNEELKEKELIESNSKISEELDKFWQSVEDGSIFENISPEIWEKVDQIVKNNPNIADNI